MPKSAAFSLCLIFCAGCSTPGDLRDDMPFLQQTSAKPPEQIAGCIGDRLQADKSAFDSTTLSVRPTTAGYSISGTQAVGVGADTILLIDITKTANGSDLKVFTHFLVGNGPARYFAAVRDCAG